MDIRFYNFSKFKNSTKQVSDSDHFNTLEGDIREDCSILNPIITINWGRLDRPPYNYTYIPEFARYYFITNWVYSGGLWEAYLEEDYLASFKPTIVASEQYVLRSTSENNSYIIDDYYSTITETDDIRNPIDTDSISNLTLGTKPKNYFTRKFEDGHFVVGVIGESNTGIVYYAMNYINFKKFIKGIFSYTPSNFGSIANGLAKQIANPLQYVSNVMWYPEAPITTYTETRSIYCGYYSIDNILCAEIGTTTAPAVQTFSAYFDLRNHPQSHDAEYMNKKTKLTLVLNPFGTFGLDPNLVHFTSNSGISEHAINIRWTVDFTTGRSFLLVTSGEALLTTATTQLGVNVPLAGYNTDYLGAISGIGSALVNTGLSTVTGKAKYIGGALGGIGNAIGSMSPSAEKIGTTGSLIAFSDTPRPRIYQTWFLDVNHNVDKYGAPLCAMKYLRHLSGFCLCEDAKIRSSAILADEATTIENMLNTGVYLE